MTQQSDSTDCIYKPHARYLWMTLGSITLFLLLAWNLLAPVVRSGQWSALNPEVGMLFFMAAAIGIALWQGRMALSRVKLTETGISLCVPFSSVRRVDFRQISTISESGRGGHVITLLYHPIGANQLVDVDDLNGLTLPEVVDQDSLLDCLESNIPT